MYLLPLWTLSSSVRSQMGWALVSSRVWLSGLSGALLPWSSSFWRYQTTRICGPPLSPGSRRRYWIVPSYHIKSPVWSLRKGCWTFAAFSNPWYASGGGSAGGGREDDEDAWSRWGGGNDGRDDDEHAWSGWGGDNDGREDDEDAWSGWGGDNDGREDDEDAWSGFAGWVGWGAGGLEVAAFVVNKIALDVFTLVVEKQNPQS